MGSNAWVPNTQWPPEPEKPAPKLQPHRAENTAAPPAATALVVAAEDGGVGRRARRGVAGVGAGAAAVPAGRRGARRFGPRSTMMEVTQVEGFFRPIPICVQRGTSVGFQCREAELDEFIIRAPPNQEWVDLP